MMAKIIETIVCIETDISAVSVMLQAIGNTHRSVKRGGTLGGGRTGGMSVTGRVGRGGSGMSGGSFNKGNTYKRCRLS